ncbi:hypothetical protein ACLOJK_011073 [Asimina triloba]
MERNVYRSIFEIYPRKSHLRVAEAVGRAAPIDPQVEDPKESCCSCTMDFLEESGFCPSTGIFYSKWDSPPFPQSPFLSLPSYLLSLTSHMLSKPAYIDAHSGAGLSYGDLRMLAASVAAALHALGIMKGDVVLVVCPNSLHFPSLVLGVMSIGAIFSTANPLNTRQEIQTQAQDSSPVLIIAAQELEPKLDGLTSRPVLLVEEFLDGLMRNPLPPACKPPHVQVSQGDTAALMYSSGTTGKSKAVVCSHRTLIAMSCQLRHVWTAEGAHPACDEVYLCVVPLFHMFGLSVFVCGTLSVGSTAVILGKYALEEMLVGVEEYGVTRLPAVPPMVVQMLRMADVAKTYDLGSLKEVICSGAPLGKEHMERFAKCFPRTMLSQVKFSFHFILSQVFEVGIYVVAVNVAVGCTHSYHFFISWVMNQ